MGHRSRAERTVVPRTPGELTQVGGVASVEAGAQPLLRGLLEVDPRRRLRGAGLRGLAWFAGFDWAGVDAGELLPPPLFELPLFAAASAPGDAPPPGNGAFDDF